MQSGTASPPLHPAQQQKFWNEQRMEMALMTTALEITDAQAQLQEDFFPTPMSSPGHSSNGSFTTDAQYYCNSELQGLDQQHLQPVPIPVSQYPTGPSSPQDSGFYCQSPYSSGSYSPRNGSLSPRTGSFSPSPHGSPAAVTATTNHFTQNSYAYTFPDATSTAPETTFELNLSTSVAPSIAPFDEYSTVPPNGSGCYLSNIMQQNCWRQLTPFDEVFGQTCMHQCSTAASPLPRTSSQTLIEPEAIQIQRFDMHRQQLVSETIDIYPLTPPSPGSPEANHCTPEFVIYPPAPLCPPAPLPANLKTSRVLKRNQKRPQKPPVIVDDSEIKDIPTSAQLWEFTLRVLRKPKYAYMISWENQKEGLFRFHDAQAFAALWGKHRNRPSMTYDKVARALRYYYKRDILCQVGGRLTYRFSQRLSKLYTPE